MRRLLWLAFVAVLSSFGLLAGLAGPASAAAVAARTVTSFDISDLGDSDRVIDGLGARVWCNNAYAPDSRPPEERVFWFNGYPAASLMPTGMPTRDTVAAVIHVEVPLSVADQAHLIDLSPGMCGFVRYWHDQQTATLGAASGFGSLLTQSGRGLNVQVYGFPELLGDGGYIFGETADGHLYPVFLMTQALRSSFTPETGDKDPAAVPDRGTVPVGNPRVAVAVLDNDDLPNRVAALEVATPPSSGTASVEQAGSAWTIVYAPHTSFVGEDRFTYRVTDELGKASETTVVIEVLGPELPPPPTTPPAEPPTEEPPTDEPPLEEPETENPPVVRDPLTPAVEPFSAATGAEDTGVDLGWFLAGLFIVSGLGVLTYAFRHWCTEARR